MNLVQQPQGKWEREPLYLVAAEEYSVRLAITDRLLAEHATFYYAENLPQLAMLMEETTRQIAIVDLVPWGMDLAAALAEYAADQGRCACICLVTEGQMAEIRTREWGGRLYLVARDRLQEGLPAVLRRCAEAQRMHRRMDELLRLERQSLYNTLSKEAEGMKPEDRSIFERDLTRRSFLKGTAAAAAAAGVAMSGGMKLLSPAEAAPGETGAGGERVVNGVCRSAGCSGNCVFNVTVRDGKIAKVTFGDVPDERYSKKICLRGLSHIHRTYDDYRLKYPLRRVGPRGGGEWEQISWDTALNEITDKWKDCWEKYGRNSVMTVGGSGNAGVAQGMGAVNWANNVFRFSHLDMTHDQALIQYSRRALGTGFTFNGNEHADLVNSKCILVWGNNITESSIQSWRFIAEAKERGAKLITIDISYPTIAAKSDIFVPIRPASDAALAMAMMQVAIEENLIDVPFIKKSTVGPFLVKESDGRYLRLSDLGPLDEGQADDIVVRGEDGAYGAKAAVADPVIRGNFTVQGIKVSPAMELLAQRVAEWTPEKAETICDVPAAKIRELLHIYVGNGPSALLVAFGPDHYANGHYTIMSILTLAMITGNIGKSGAFTGISALIDAYVANYGVYQDPGSIAAQHQTEISLAAIPIQQFESVLQTGQWKGQQAVLKCLFCAASNPIGTSGDTNKVRELLNQFELIAVADSTLSDTAQFADIVLPVPHWFEMEDVTIWNPPFAVMQEKAIEPLYECKTDFEIMKLLAARMGVGEKFQNMSVEDFLREYLNSAALQSLGITYEALKEKKAIRIRPYPLVHGQGGVFPTETGRVQFYLENAAPTYEFGQEWDARKEKLPILFEQPLEAWPGNPLREKYPFIMYQEHARWRVHTTWNRAPWLRELDPEPIIKMNSRDAAAKGIKNGDIVKAFNDRGHVVLKAVINDGLCPGVVNIPKGWGADQFIDGHYQSLLSMNTNPVCINTPCYDTLVDVVKV